MLVAFIILWTSWPSLAGPSSTRCLRKRANSIRDDLKNAEEARQESERVLVDYQQQLAEAKVEASKIVADAKKAGEDVKADITAKAQAEAAGMIEKAHAAIEAEKKAAIADLQGSVADLSINVAASSSATTSTNGEASANDDAVCAEAGNFNPK